MVADREESGEDIKPVGGINAFNVGVGCVHEHGQAIFDIPAQVGNGSPGGGSAIGEGGWLCGWPTVMQMGSFPGVVCDMGGGGVGGCQVS